MPEESRLAVYHQVLSRARGSSRAVRQVLLDLWLPSLAPDTGPLLFGVDETIARRKGAQITAKGVYQDGVWASHRHFVKIMSLRWIYLVGRAYIPWAWPLLTVQAPSHRYHATRGNPHKTIMDWARQMLGCLRRWWPDRERVVVGDRRDACLRCRAFCQQLSPPLTFLTLLRRDAVARRGTPWLPQDA